MHYSKTLNRSCKKFVLRTLSVWRWEQTQDKWRGRRRISKSTGLTCLASTCILGTLFREDAVWQDDVKVCRMTLCIWNLPMDSVFKFLLRGEFCKETWHGGMHTHNQHKVGIGGRVCKISFTILILLLKEQAILCNFVLLLFIFT